MEVEYSKSTRYGIETDTDAEKQEPGRCLFLALMIENAGSVSRRPSEVELACSKAQGPFSSVDLLRAAL